MYEQDISSPGTRLTSASTNVVFPVPEGADTTNKFPFIPTRSTSSSPDALFHVLDLLSEPFKLRLGPYNPLTYVDTCDFRA